MKKYYTRIIDSQLESDLNIFGGVLLTGPKACGKTTSARRLAKSVLYMQDPARKQNYLALAQIDPAQLLEGESPRLIDEWQLAPELWDAIRHSIDMKGETGLYMLTGSTTVNEGQIQHSGAGRIARLRMRPMSSFESGDSNGKVSFENLFNNDSQISGFSSLTIKDIAYIIARGGWPSVIGMSATDAMRYVQAYCDTLAETEIQTLDGKKRDKAKTLSILRSLARNVGSMASDSTILSDVLTHHEALHRHTLSDYLIALNRLYVTDNVQAWTPKLRSKTQIRTSDKRFFVDPSIAASMLGASPEKMFLDMNTFGFLFESLVIRDLKVYAESLGGNIFHYRDKSGLEADAVMQLMDGRWGLIEVKLGGKEIDKAAERLKTLSEIIDTSTLGPPSFLMIVTGTEYAYRREDGILIVPVGCLKN